MYSLGHGLRSVFYAAVAAASMGVGLSLLLNLDKTIILPFFPDVMDAMIIMLVGTLLLIEVFRDS